MAAFRFSIKVEIYELSSLSQGKSLDLIQAIRQLILDWRIVGAKYMNSPFCDVQ